MKKRTKIVLFTSAILLVVICGYLIKTNRFNADMVMSPIYKMNIPGIGTGPVSPPSPTASAQKPLTEDQITSLVDAHIKETGTYASALMPELSKYPNPPLGFYSPMEFANIELYDKLINADCIKLFYEKHSPEQTRLTDKYEIKIPGGGGDVCKYTISVISPSLGSAPQSSKEITLTGSYNIIDTSEVVLPSNYKNPSIKNTGSETRNFSIDITFESVAKLYSKNDKWALKSPAIHKVYGSYSSLNRYDMTGSEDLFKSAEARNDPIIKNISPDSTWKAKTVGSVDFGADGTFELNKFKRPVGDFEEICNIGEDAAKCYALMQEWKQQFMLVDQSIKLTKLEFCPNGCKISIEENLDIESKQDKTFPKGTITSEVNHKETYTGFGQSDLAAKSISWKSLVLDKTDNRKWSQSLTYANGKHVEYYGSNLTEGRLQPLTLQLATGKKMNIDSTVIRDITITDNPSSKVMISSRREARIYKKEKNIDGAVTASGTSYSLTRYGANPPYEEIGVFDNPDGSVKLTAPVSMKGRRVSDPFFLSDISPYTSNIYNSGTAYVPGLFTASYKATETLATISTRSAKLLPEKLYVFRSYDKSDPVLLPAVMSYIDIWLKTLAAKGITVVNVDTNSPIKLKNAFANAKTGDWIFNLGHGLPTGLVAGFEINKVKGSNIVSYKDIQSILKKKGVRIDVFSGISCYSGRAGLASTVIGPTGVGIAILGETLGNTMGIGGNSWNMTIDDVESALNEIIAKTPKKK